MARNSGSLETLGDPIGEKMVSSDFAVELTTWLLRVTALGPRLRILGLNQCGIRQLRRRKMIPTMTQLSMNSLNLSLRLQLAISLTTSSAMSKGAAEFRPLHSRVVKSKPPLTPGMSLQRKIFLLESTGETRMALTGFPGTKTSTFLNTADHAGLKVQLQPLLIDSTS